MAARRGIWGSSEVTGTRPGQPSGREFGRAVPICSVGSPAHSTVASPPRACLESDPTGRTRENPRRANWPPPRCSRTRRAVLRNGWPCRFRPSGGFVTVLKSGPLRATRGGGQDQPPRGGVAPSALPTGLSSEPVGSVAAAARAHQLPQQYRGVSVSGERSESRKTRLLLRTCMTAMHLSCCAKSLARITLVSAGTPRLPSVGGRIAPHQQDADRRQHIRRSVRRSVAIGRWRMQGRSLLFAALPGPAAKVSAATRGCRNATNVPTISVKGAM